MAQVRYPLLYQLNTRVWLTELSRKLGRTATLDAIPDATLDRLAERGFEDVWFLSVWQTGLDHPWVEEHPEYYIPSTELDLAQAPQNYTWVKRPQGTRPGHY
jgi:hypothetical protein